MIAEPYICTSPSRAGEIQYFSKIDPRFVDSDGEYHHQGVSWRVYADFEREKLRELGSVKSAYCNFYGISVSCQDCYFVLFRRLDCEDKRCKFPWYTLHGDRLGERSHCHHYSSACLIDYHPADYDHDSESNRLLKRAEFLKAVCEKEGVEWIPSCTHRKIRCPDPSIEIVCKRCGFILNSI